MAKNITIDYGCRWEDALQVAIDKLGGGKKVLRVDYESDYQGFLDIDILLNDGRVFSYKYYYGSCSGCDQWEDDYESEYDKSYPRLSELMIQEATIFTNQNEYGKWRDMINQKGEL